MLGKGVMVLVKLFDHACIILLVICSLKSDSLLFCNDVLELGFINITDKLFNYVLQLLFNKNVTGFQDTVSLSLLSNQFFIPFDLTRVLLNGLSSIV